MVHERTHHCGVGHCRLVLTRPATQTREGVAVVVVVVGTAAVVVVIVATGGRAGGDAVGGRVLGWRWGEREKMVACATTAMAGETSGARWQRGTERTLGFVVVHRAGRRTRRRRESPGGFRRVCTAAGEPGVQNGTVEVRPADLADWATGYAAAGHPCVSVVRGGSSGVVGGGSGMGVVTPVIGGVADDPGDPCASR